MGQNVFPKRDLVFVKDRGAILVEVYFSVNAVVLSYDAPYKHLLLWALS
jgi:hypothetical protein